MAGHHPTVATVAGATRHHSAGIGKSPATAHAHSSSSRAVLAEAAIYHAAGSHARHGPRAARSASSRHSGGDHASARPFFATTETAEARLGAHRPADDGPAALAAGASARAEGLDFGLQGLQVALHLGVATGRFDQVGLELLHGLFQAVAGFGGAALPREERAADEGHGAGEGRRPQDQALGQGHGLNGPQGECGRPGGRLRGE